GQCAARAKPRMAQLRRLQLELEELADARPATRHLDYRTQASSRCARPSPPARERPEGIPITYRWLHGGVGNRSLPVAAFSGQTISHRPLCHWVRTSLCPTW